ncbi:DUF6449 domain-containing protein [Fusibacter sp. 3D3]|uniref:DUF6449 domain-containing protein n=1 Tax=Fusibacter sp. 3D3 TaxID=1048380 RepID=UPI000852F3FC|nr:DUF6449 domain-containing protein [Fusibacter sp. 3D3]GAU78733.1 hypothetical protein F3D3_3368 [Fusibacter sp. 3D3]
MKLKKSFYNSHVIRHDLTYFGWISGIYIILLLLTGPVASLSGEEKFAAYMLNLLDFAAQLHLFTIVVVPIALGLFQFKYLHNQVQISRIHSFPFTRYEWLGTKLITGLLILWIPQMFFTLFVIIFYPSAEFIGNQLIHTPLEFLALNCVYMLNIYLFSVLISVMSGFTIAATLMTLIFFSVPYGLLTLLYNNLEMTLKGFYYNYNFLDKVILKLSPFTVLFEFSSQKISVMTYASMGGFFFIFLISIFYLYSKRKDESAGDVLAFSILKPIFIVGVTICSIFVIGTYVSVLYENETALFIGYLIGGTLGYYIAHMIVNKKFNVFKRYIKGYGVVLLLIVLFQGILCFDVTGFESKVPNTDAIESVVFEQLYASNTEGKHNIYQSVSNIETIRALHQKLVDEDVSSKTGKSFYIQYNLSNGTKIKRQYIIEELRYKSLFESLYNSASYKKQTYDIFDLNPSDISMALIESNEFWNNREKFEQVADLEELIAVLKQDIMAATADDLVFNRYEQAHIIFYDNRLNINVNIASIEDQESNASGELKSFDEIDDEAIIVDIPLNSKFLNTKAWLDEKGILANIALKPEAVSYIVLEEVGVKSTATTVIGEDTKTVNVVEPEWIKCVLEHMSYGEYFDEKEPYYVVGVGLKDKIDGMVYAYIQKKDLPTEVLTQFRR